jgi:hypothetical protein
MDFFSSSSTSWMPSCETRIAESVESSLHTETRRECDSDVLLLRARDIVNFIGQLLDLGKSEMDRECKSAQTRDALDQSFLSHCTTTLACSRNVALWPLRSFCHCARSATTSKTSINDLVELILQIFVCLACAGASAACGWSHPQAHLGAA